MKLVMTGLATEHDFDSNDGDVLYVLIFNKGELRIPITKESVEKILQHVHGGEKKNGKTSTITVEEVPEYQGEIFSSDSVPPPDDMEVTDDEDGTPQV